MVGLKKASEEGQLLTTVDVAALLCLEVATLVDWRHRQKGPRFYHMGREVRYKLEDVLTWQRQALVVVDPQEI